jgi:hypothetical protein
VLGEYPMGAVCWSNRHVISAIGRATDRRIAETEHTKIIPQLMSFLHCSMLPEMLVASGSWPIDHGYKLFAGGSWPIAEDCKFCRLTQAPRGLPLVAL